MNPVKPPVAARVLRIDGCTMRTSLFWRYAYWPCGRGLVRNREMVVAYVGCRGVVLKSALIQFEEIFVKLLQRAGSVIVPEG